MNEEALEKKEEGEIGRFQINPTDHILVSLKQYKGKQYVDIRKYVISDGFTGFTKQGVRFAVDLFDQFAGLVEGLKEALSNKSL